MRIKGVEFDDRLLAAQREGSLVVFAGAGVSMGPPSNYPSFKELAEKIGKLARDKIKNDEPNEYYFGRLVLRDFPVHERVKHLLSDSASKPKGLHEDLLRLFSDKNRVRLVTTNFDSHFETAAKDVYGKAPEVFRSPALPPGHDFRGLVYLHGSVLDDSRRLILTDHDFGRAYLTEGWATRFLLSMFSRYTVLFVGYSHNDTVMHYLSRGLPPERTGTRFALVGEDVNMDEWRYRGIDPLAYPLEGAEKNHSRLDLAIAGWADLANRGALDTEQRIKDLVQGQPPLDQESQDYLLWATKDPITLRFFVRHAKRTEWLTWAADHGLLDALFSRERLSEQHKELSFWIADTYAVEHRESVFAILESRNTSFHPEFAYQIVRRLAYMKMPPNKDTISRWMPILVQNSMSEHSLQSLPFMKLLERAIDIDAISAVALLFAYLTKPCLLLRKSLIQRQDQNKDKNTVDAEVRLEDHHNLNEIWDKKLRPRLGELALWLWPNIVQNLNEAYQLLHAWGKAASDWDPLSFGRSGIEPHEQDKHPTTTDILIDAARDCLEWALHTHERIGHAWIESLAATDSQILQRLAIHGISIANHLSPAEKVRWLLDKKLVKFLGLKHEVFQLLRETYPKLDSELRKTLIEAAIIEIDSLPVEDKGINEYEKFNLFYWLFLVDPLCEEARKRLTEIKEKFPHFREREHPDLDSRVSEATWSGPRSPLTVDELLEKQPSELIDYLVDFVGDDFLGPDRNGLLITVREAAARNFDWAKALIRCLIERNDPISDLWESVIRGLQNAELTAQQWDFVLSIFREELGLTKHHPNDIADLLKHGAQKEKGGIPPSLLGKADAVAQTIWATLEEKEIEECNDWVMRAINHPGGKLTLFWCHALSKSRNESRDNHEGLIQPYKKRFNEIIRDRSDAGALGRVILASQLGFLYFLDETWSRKNVVPLFDWNKGARQARQAWDGWLTWGRPFGPVLDELLPHYRNAFSHLLSELRNERKRFVEHVAGISLFGMNDPLEENWLYDFLEKVEEEDRVSFASHLSNRLMTMEEETKSGLWKRWLKRYWLDRNQGVPLPLADGELNRMVEWAGELQPVFPEVVDIICSGPIPILDHASAFYRMKKAETGLSVRYPEATCRLLIHLVSRANVPIYFCDDLEELTDQVISSGAPADLLNKLCERLAEIGCPKAGELSRRIRS